MWRICLPSVGSTSPTRAFVVGCSNSDRALRRCRPRPSDRWHLDEIVVRIAGKHMYLWRAVDHEGEVLEILVQRRRDRSDDISRFVDTATLPSTNREARSGALHRSPPPPEQFVDDSQLE